MALAEIIFGAAVGTAITPCFAEEPTTVTVTGTLAEETYPGPPNFESVASGDKPERVFELVYSPHICTSGTSGSSSDYPFDEPYADVEKTELVFLDDPYKLYDILRPFLGKPVQCDGKLFGADNAEHHTPVLIQIANKTDCRPVTNNSGNDAVTKSLQQFVQEFYDWYVPHSVTGSPLRAVDLALKQRPSAFSTSLGQALRDDSSARAKTPDMIVGLDFDPFLASQDPCEQYEAGQIIEDRNGYRVSIFAICSGKRDKKPAVIAELEEKSGTWVFVNFDYPGRGDLLAVLASLKKGRR